MVLTRPLRPAPRRVFISSTVKDLAEYRRRLARGLEELHQDLRCRLSEDWANSFSQVSQRVLEVLEESEGYYGIFAHYHGYMPPNEPHSITRMEFEAALELWGDDVPPFIAVFVPEIGSTADQELLAAAERELQRQYPGAPEKWREQLELQKQFRAYVSGKGRAVTHFADEVELVTRASLVYRDWNGELLQAARQQELEPVDDRQPTDEELGRLGRQAQAAQLRELLAQRELQGDVPLAVLIEGDEEMGHAKFARALLADELRGYRTVWGCPAGTSFDADALAGWLLRDLTKSVGEKGKQVSALAEALQHRLLDKRPIAVVLTRASFRGGLEAFWNDFWAPIVGALAVPNGRRRQPLVLLVLDSEVRGAKGASLAEGTAASASLPEGTVGSIELTRFSPSQIMQWLQQHAVPDDPKRSRKEIVDDVLSKKNGDPSPETVFRRLALANLWPGVAEGGP